ncbi:ABC transporter ATP-binding protein [Arenibacterium sp. LLYu02]|uniref:ABC transporter ATP-binding protein n=1 Tax=Arenibacterium sp. LLYu02 TaxID=3404132 RepID=UPI003B221E5B
MPLLTVENLRTTFPSAAGRANVVDGVSFTLEPGEVLGIVGESGSGKSMTAMSIMRLLKEPPARIEADRLDFDGRDLLALGQDQMRDVRARDISMVFQDPMRSLNPVLTIGRQLTETLRRHTDLSRRAARERAVELLNLVGIPAARRRMSEYPHQFSGGMRQRAMIAIAICCEPRLLIADEATTALDVTVQAQIVELMQRLNQEMGMAMIWISHDLGLVAGLCDKVAVMYSGRLVEFGPTRALFQNPSHGYTVGLLRCTPRLDVPGRRLEPIPGYPPDITSKKTLCPFLPRCAVAVPDCHRHYPKDRAIGPAHTAACHVSFHSQPAEASA